MLGQLSTTCSNVLKQPNGKLLIAVNHNQLRIMASETVEPIDRSHHPPSWPVPSERLVHSINQCNFSGNRTCNRSMRGNHLAYAATQGISHFLFTMAIVMARNLHDDFRFIPRLWWIHLILDMPEFSSVQHSLSSCCCCWAASCASASNINTFNI